MMQCPLCSAPLTSGEARCGACFALVNPPVHGASALAPRLVTPRSIDSGPSDTAGSESESPVFPTPPTAQNPDEAWRREVLERVRKRRQARAHALPLFVDGQPSAPPPEDSSPSRTPSSDLDREAPAAFSGDEPDGESDPRIDERIDNADPRSASPAPDLLSALDMPMTAAPMTAADEDDVLDLPLRPVEPERPVSGAGPSLSSAQSLVERPRPAPFGTGGSRSLVADLPLVEPSRLDPLPHELPPRSSSPAVSSRAAALSDRLQAAFIDLGVWSAMSATAFYFASRIARTSIVGLGPAWQGLALFGFVLAAAYILFFGGLSGATPGKIACGIQVKRYDGSPLGPLASLGRGLLGIVGVVFLGVSIWPAFWDKDRRALHDRATDSRVTTV